MVVSISSGSDELNVVMNISVNIFDGIDVSVLSSWFIVLLIVWFDMVVSSLSVVLVSVVSSMVVSVSSMVSCVLYRMWFSMLWLRKLELNGSFVLNGVNIFGVMIVLMLCGVSSGVNIVMNSIRLIIDRLMWLLVVSLMCVLWCLWGWLGDGVVGGVVFFYGVCGLFDGGSVLL